MSTPDDKTQISSVRPATLDEFVLPQGYELGSWVVDSLIGSGGFALTYLARHRYISAKYAAIKEYLPEGAAIRDSHSGVRAISQRQENIYAWGLGRFLEEAQTISKFQHHNVVEVQDYFERNNTAYMVMEYVRGDSIRDIIDKGGRFSEERLREIMFPLLDALSVLHRSNVFHRDITPSNILIREDNSPVLIDFGSARCAMRVRGTGEHKPTIIYTPGYAPIEQQEQTEQGPFTDIYALGATLYYAAFQQRPVDSSMRSGELRAGNGDPLQPAQRIGAGKFSPEFLNIIDAALQLDPTKRPQAVEEWLAILGVPLPAEPALWNAQEELSRVNVGIETLEPAWAQLKTVGTLRKVRQLLEERPLAPEAWTQAAQLLSDVAAIEGERSRAQSALGALAALEAVQSAIEQKRFVAARARIEEAEALLAELGIDELTVAREALPAMGEPAPDPQADLRQYWAGQLLSWVLIMASLPVSWLLRRLWRGYRPHMHQKQRPTCPTNPTVTTDKPPAAYNPTVIEPPPPGGAPSHPPEANEISPAFDATHVFQAPAAGTRQGLPPAALAITQCADATRIGTKVPLKRFPFRIGRTDEVDLAIPSDQGLSREHAILEYGAGEFTLRDAGSTNGVYLNGNRVASGSAAPLLFGDVIRLTGLTTLTFVFSDDWRLPDLTGRVVDAHYRLYELLHTSVKGALYLAEDLRLRRGVILKILSPRLVPYTNDGELFNREAETAAQLDHPQICKVLDFGQAEVPMADGETLWVNYLCVEYKKAGSLADRIARREDITLNRIGQWLRKLSSALDYAHRKQVVHAGIKPTAILFDSEDDPYLADFAIASRLGQAGGRAVVGSRAFLAPEQLDGEEPTPATDQYALAALAYLLVTSSRPYEGQEIPAVRARDFLRGPVPAHEEATRQGRTDVPATVSTVLGRALAIQPGDRYPSVGEFSRAFNEVLSAGGVGAPTVFLSYSRDASVEWATLIARELQTSHAIKVFLDTQQVDASGRFPLRLQRAIEGCDFFLCLLSAETLTSDWVQREIRLAFEQHKPMVPIFQESFDPSVYAKGVDRHIGELLNYDGVHLLDRHNIHVDYTIAELARIVREVQPVLRVDLSDR